jgi:hypothetical protein
MAALESDPVIRSCPVPEPTLRAAELASRALRDAEDRRRFVAQVRRVLGDDIERGEPLQPVRLREGAATKDRRSLSRE